MIAESTARLNRILNGARQRPALASVPAGLRLALSVQGHDAAAAFSQNQFFLGHSAMLVNEGLPAFVMINSRKTTARRQEGRRRSHGLQSEVMIREQPLLQVEEDFADQSAARAQRPDPFVKDSGARALEQVLAEAMHWSSVHRTSSIGG